MKRKSPVIIIVFSLITLTLGYLAYVKIIKPLYQNNLSQNFEIKLDKDRELGIGKSNSQGKIFAVEMELSGRSDNHFNLAISDGKKIIQHARVKGGEKVSFTFVKDYYNDSIFVKFYPEKDDSGVLSLDCRFLGR